jgi:putative transposase
MVTFGLLHRPQADCMAYLIEENRVLKDPLRGQRLRLTNDQHRGLAAKAKLLGRQALNRIATIVTPETLMRWHKRLIAALVHYSVLSEA